MNENDCGNNTNVRSTRRKYTTSIDSAKGSVDKLRRVEDLEVLRSYVDEVMQEREKERMQEKRVTDIIKKPELLEIINMLEFKCVVCDKELWTREGQMWEGVVVHRCAVPTMIHASCCKALAAGVVRCNRCNTHLTGENPFPFDM